MWKAVIISLLLGTTTVAVADQPYSQPYRGERYRDYGDRYDTRRHHVVLARNVTLGSRYRSAAWVPIDARLDLRHVRLRLERGATFVERVILVYANGARQLVPIRRTLTARRPLLTIGLPRRGVRGLLIDSTPLYGARGGGWQRYYATATVDVIGLR